MIHQIKLLIIWKRVDGGIKTHMDQMGCLRQDVELEGFKFTIVKSLNFDGTENRRTWDESYHNIIRWIAFKWDLRAVLPQHQNWA